MSEPLEFERLAIKGEEPVKRALYRAKVPGGWLVRDVEGNSLLFIEDAANTWDVAKLRT